MDLDNTQTSRMRLMTAGKMLFSRNGYEQTSTAAIAREAGTSESQLMRYFGGKSGLLEAIFNETWSGLSEGIAAQISGAEHGREAILRLLSLFVSAFGRDHDAAFIFLFEGRRVRGNDVVLSEGFKRFTELLNQLIQRGQEDGSFRSDLDPTAICSATLGCAEGMIRDALIAERTHKPRPFDNETIQKVFAAMVGGLAPMPRTTPSS
ncbi:MAG TPA: TetR/AcrR family transcriptional regulator [Thermoanaerobaculia bacterium]|nr:TetR/AcrR family transcriptional regulator [Thermoanaerobaculia bacterium]